MLIGKPRSGKTSLLYSLFKSKHLLKKVFENIFLFQPSHSRLSMKDKRLFDQLDNKFDELTYLNLKYVVDTIKYEVEEENINNCIIFDDMEPDIRKLFSNIFLFKVSKHEMEDIMDEIYEGNKQNIDQIIKIVYDQPYNYLFINTDTQRMFKNFDELIFSDNI